MFQELLQPLPEFAGDIAERGGPAVLLLCLQQATCGGSRDMHQCRRLECRHTSPGMITTWSTSVPAT